MNEAWFNPMYWSWVPGTVIGSLAGVWGSLAGLLAPRGARRSLVMGMGLALVGVSAVVLVAGLVAVATGQPYGVWYGLLMAGFIGCGVVGPLLPVVRGRYRHAEERRMQARDFS